MFVTFEGGEGSGKSTLMFGVSEELSDRGFDILCTREPGGTPLGTQLRAAVLESSGDLPDPLAEALVFAADRAEHVAKVIAPALSEGRIVLCDRFSDSTFAYQSEAIPRSALETLDGLARSGVYPSMTVLMGVDVDVAMSRVSIRGGADRFDSMPREFHSRVLDRYARMAAEEPDRFLVVSSSTTPSEVADEVLGRMGGEGVSS